MAKSILVQAVGKGSIDDLSEVIAQTWRELPPDERQERLADMEQFIAKCPDPHTRAEP